MYVNRMSPHVTNEEVHVCANGSKTPSTQMSQNVRKRTFKHAPSEDSDQSAHSRDLFYQQKKKKKKKKKRKCWKHSKNNNNNKKTVERIR